MLADAGEFIIGLLILVLGSEFLLRGAAGLKRFFRVPEFVIGLAIVGFGTSLPELIIGLGAAEVGAQELAVGMVIGSNIFNLLVILAIAALIIPLKTDDRALKRDGWFMALSAVAVGGLALYGRINLATALILLGILALYIAIVVVEERKLPADTKSLYSSKAAMLVKVPKSPIVGAIVALLGAAMLTYGSGLVIESTVGFAVDYGVGEAIIGLFLVAIVTSAPELVVSVIAARRKLYGVAVGNILGSNIFNGFGILGLIGITEPTRWPAGLMGGDIVALILASLGLWWALASDHCLTRREGFIALVLFIAYTVWRFSVTM
ncbi:MAG: calcium/sodium antiporter [Sphingomonadales bacterium]|jgi:cation:H+ antiporter